MRSTLILGLVAALAVPWGTAGCDKKSDDPRAPAMIATVTASGARAVPIKVDDKGFTPSSVEVKKAEKVQLVFTRTSDDTCAKEVVFPEINVKKTLPLNTAVAIDVPTDTARTLTFQCGMAMFKSKVVVN
jgi:plastocyanin domain-containing protein